MRRNITTWIKPFHAIPNEVAVPTPFGIYPPDEKLGYHESPLIFQYGNIEMRISGRKLNTKDQDVFIALTEIATERKSLKFTTSVNELCRKLKRPYAKTSKQSIKNSLRRLREALVETVSFNGDDRKEENANWIIHGMITFAAGNRKDELRIELDDSFNRLFGKRLLMTLFDTQFRLSLKGNVSKALYLFYQRQISAKQRSTYPIGIEKLCCLIGLDIKQRLTLPTKRHRIKKGGEELVNKGYLKSYNLKPNDVLVVMFDKKWLKGRKKQLAESRPETAKPEEKTNPTPPLIKKSEEKNGLLGYLEKEVGIKIEKNVELAEENITKIQAVGKALGAYEFFNKFVSWIKEQHDSGDGWLKSIHAGTFNPENNVFTCFMRYMELKMPSAKAIDKQFKFLTETPDEKEQRQKRERKEKEKKEHEDREYQADIKWAQNYTKDNLKNLSEKDIDEVKQMIRHGKNWKESFKEFVQAVKKKHKSGKGNRSCSYCFLFKAGSRLWNEIFEPEIEDDLEDLLEDHFNSSLNECDVM